MSIADQITRLSNAKAAIKTSIENKGITVGNDVKLDGYPALIDSIEAGGGSGETHVNPDFYELRTQNGTNFDHLFRGYNGPDIDVSQWDTSKLTSAQYCFSYCTKSMDISNWDLSSLTNAQYMFDNFTNGNKYIDLSVLNFSNATIVTSMFSTSNIDYLDVRNINLTGATSYNYLFQSCYGTELDLSNWDISKVNDLSNLCYFSSLKKINLTGWNTVNVKYMSSVFYYAQSLETLLIPDWDMTNATSTSSFLGSVPKLKYIDLSRSNDLTINKIAPMLQTKTATTYGEILIPANTSQDAIDALIAKYWKPIGPKIDLTSTELALELYEIKPGKTTKVWTGNNDPWYGDDRPETIEFISSDESIATVNGREITGVAEGTVTIECRRREDNVIISTAPVTITVSETDSNPNLIIFRTDGSESSSSTLIKVNEKDITTSMCTKYSANIYSYDPGEKINKVMFNTGVSYYNNCIIDVIKLNFNESNITNMAYMFYYFKGTEINLNDWDTSKVTNMYSTFYGCNLRTIIGEIDCSLIEGFYKSYNNPFYECYSLETLYLKNIYKNCTMTNNIEWSINLGSTKVKDECLLYIINELPDLYAKGLTKTDQITFTLPPTNTLTQEQIAVGIAKGWTFINVNN